VAGIQRRQLSALPPGMSFAMRAILPSSAMNGVNGAVASAAAEWLVGPTSTEQMSWQGGKQVTVVNVKKCRYLEASGCAGVCVNMCKLPTQDVIATEFGVPLYMQPNFKVGPGRYCSPRQPTHFESCSLECNDTL